MSNHQHTLIIDGTSGISGDMTVAALLDLGASEEHLREQLATLPVDGFTNRSGGAAGGDFLAFWVAPSFAAAGDAAGAFDLARLPRRCARSRRA